MKTPALAMQQVYSLTKALYYGAADARIAATKLGALRQQIAKLQLRATPCQGCRRVRGRRRSARGNAARDAAAGAWRGGGGEPARVEAAAAPAPRPTRCGR